MSTSPLNNPSLPIFYDAQPETRAFFGDNLPHWDVIGRPIFLTLHVRGAIPAQAMQRIREDAANLSRDRDTDYAIRLKLIFAAMDQWLDRAEHVQWLVNPQVAALLREAINARTENGSWRALHWVIMPSHIHILYMGGAVSMKGVIGSFKRWTGKRANELLSRSGNRFWQDEWFDHWSRSADETDRIAHYIHQNPVRAGLVNNAGDWQFGSWSKSTL